MRPVQDHPVQDAPPFDPDDPGYGALTLANAVAPTIITSWPSDWAGRPAEEAAQIIADVPDIFLQGKKRELIWVDDRPGVRAHVEPVTIDHLRALFARERVQFRERKTQDRAPACEAPRTLLASVISLRPAKSWKFLKGIAPSPYILADGEIIGSRGWTDRTELWLSGHSVVDLSRSRVPLHAKGFTREQAREALLAVLTPLAEVPWSDPLLDPVVWLAYLLTLSCRPAMDFAPLFLFEASLSGSGKDFIIKCAELGVLGDTSCRVTLTGGKDAQRDDENRIATPIAEGEVNFVLADLKDLGNPLLLNLLTEGPKASVRRLGVQQSIPVPYCITIAGTGNNIAINVPDIVRRTIHCRLEPATEDPEAGKFSQTQTQILAEFLNDRATILAVCFNVLRGWIHAADKSTRVECTGFNIWGEMVASALTWAGFANVLDTQPRMKLSVPQEERDSVRALLMAWWPVRESHGTTVAQIEMIRCQAFLTPEEAAFMDAINALGDDKPLPKKALTAKLKTFRGKTCRLTDGTRTFTVRFQPKEDKHGIWAFSLVPIR